MSEWKFERLTRMQTELPFRPWWDQCARLAELLEERVTFDKPLSKGHNEWVKRAHTELDKLRVSEEKLSTEKLMALHLDALAELVKKLEARCD